MHRTSHGCLNPKTPYIKQTAYHIATPHTRGVSNDVNMVYFKISPIFILHSDALLQRAAHYLPQHHVGLVVAGWKEVLTLLQTFPNPHLGSPPCNADLMPFLTYSRIWIQNYTRENLIYLCSPRMTKDLELNTLR